MHPVSSTSLWNSRTRLYHSTSTSPVVTDPSLVSNNVKPHENDQKNDHHHHHNGDDEKDPKTLQPGVSEGFFIIEEFPVPTDGLDISSLDDKMIDRLDLQPHNMSLPVALTLLAPHHYGSMSKARKACRKMNILIHRGPLGVDAETGKEGIFDLDKCVRGLVGHRVYAGDVIARQVRVGDGSYQQTHYEQPYDLPVVYQDDHFAIVNKPAGVVVYPSKSGIDGVMSVKSCLPFVIDPPSEGTHAVMRRPQSVHRLDKPTCGLLLIAKTKPAMTAITDQFVARKIRKTYTAIVNGIPPISRANATLSSQQAFDLGVDVNRHDQHTEWHLIDYPLEGKEATTLWRPITTSNCLKAVIHDNNMTVTLVELKPKSGRYHQLRRHMAWICDTPLVGDKTYDGGRDEAKALRKRGLMLCSNQLLLEHPYYNTNQGRKAWGRLVKKHNNNNNIDDEDGLSSKSRHDEKQTQKIDCGLATLYLDEETGLVMVRAAIDLPDKFKNFLEREDARYQKFMNGDEVSDDSDDDTDEGSFEEDEQEGMDDDDTAGSHDDDDEEQ